MKIDPRNEAHLLYAKLTEVVVILVKLICVFAHKKAVVIFVDPFLIPLVSSLGVRACGLFVLCGAS